MSRRAKEQPGDPGNPLVEQRRLVRPAQRLRVVRPITKVNPAVWSAEQRVALLTKHRQLPLETPARLRTQSRTGPTAGAHNHLPCWHIGGYVPIASGPEPR